VKIIVVASGSAGNATMFESGGTRVLVDAGIGPRTLVKKLAEVGEHALPDAIVITHAHGDHIGHCESLARQLDVPVWVSESTKRVARLAGVDRVRVFGARHPFAIGALTLSPVPLPHDAAQVGFVISDGQRSAAIATDLGEVPPALPDRLAACDVILIESNYDPVMLAGGPYLPHLKRRVASASGHLSNAQTHELLRRLPRATHTVVLMHLSETNNQRHLALDSATDALAWRNVHLFAATQHVPLVIDAAAAPPREPLRTRNAKPLQLALF
jgi:phosphoribosyl 1,2-cyclic phosphodiesterase